MQTHLLSEHERLMIREYLEKNNKIGNFRLLKFRVLRNFKAIEKDYDLILALKKSLENSDT